MGAVDGNENADDAIYIIGVFQGEMAENVGSARRIELPGRQSLRIFPTCANVTSAVR
jgi:hypothetical protein